MNEQRRFADIPEAELREAISEMCDTLRIPGSVVDTRASYDLFALIIGEQQRVRESERAWRESGKEVPPMMVYINYPNPHFTIHHNPDCGFVTRERKQRRIVTITMRNLKDELMKFINNEYQFGADRETNDMWLDISLDTPKQDESLVYVIQAILGIHYKPFQDVPIGVHCDS